MEDFNKKDLTNLDSKNSAWELIYELKAGGFLKNSKDMNEVHLYLLSCCRRIWPLLPDSGSRRGIITAEKYCQGQATREQIHEIDWYSEASAFMFDYFEEGDPKILMYIEHIEKNREIISRLLVPPISVEEISALELLKDAAYFANFSLNYPFILFGDAHRKSMEERGRFMPLELFKCNVSKDLISKIKNISIY